VLLYYGGWEGFNNSLYDTSALQIVTQGVGLVFRRTFVHTVMNLQVLWTALAEQLLASEEMLSFIKTGI
jgi:hypothetical protein